MMAADGADAGQPDAHVELPCHRHAISPGWAFDDVFRLTESEEVSIKRGLANYPKVKYTDTLNGTHPFATSVSGIPPCDPEVIKKRFEEFTTCKLDSVMDAKMRASKMEAFRLGSHGGRVVAYLCLPRRDHNIS